MKNGNRKKERKRGGDVIVVYGVITMTGMMMAKEHHSFTL